LALDSRRLRDWPDRKTADRSILGDAMSVPVFAET
jgi:hypothetical protein